MFESVKNMTDLEVSKVFSLVKSYLKTYNEVLLVNGLEVVYLDYYVVSEINGVQRGFEDELVYKLQSYKIGEKPKDYYMGMHEKSFSICEKRKFLEGIDIAKINGIYTVECANKVLRKEDTHKKGIRALNNINSLNDSDIVELFYDVKEYLKRSGEILDLKGYRVKYIDYHVVREVSGEPMGFQDELVYVGKSYSNEGVSDIYMGMNERGFNVKDMRKLLENIECDKLERILVSLSASEVLTKNIKNR